MSQIISILNQKGGVGKTTTALNLAAYLSKSNHKVLIVDIDPQANATTGIGLDKSKVIYGTKELILADIKFTDLITRIDDNLDIIAANQDLAEIEIELVNVSNREFKLKNALSINLGYDFIIIDCPPSLSILTVNALTSSNFVLVPVQAEFYAMEGLSQLLEIIQLIKSGLNPSLELLGILITMFDSRNSLSNQVVKELQEYFKDKVFKTFIPRNVRLAEAPSYGQSIMTYDRWSKGARAYKQFSHEFIDRIKLVS